jgi:hypothetical protein
MASQRPAASLKKLPLPKLEGKKPAPKRDAPRPLAEVSLSAKSSVKKIDSRVGTPPPASARVSKQFPPSVDKHTSSRSIGGGINPSLKATAKPAPTASSRVSKPAIKLKPETDKSTELPLKKAQQSPNHKQSVQQVKNKMLSTSVVCPPNPFKELDLKEERRNSDVLPPSADMLLSEYESEKAMTTVRTADSRSRAHLPGGRKEDHLPLGHLRRPVRAILRQAAGRRARVPAEEQPEEHRAVYAPVTQT